MEIEKKYLVKKIPDELEQCEVWEIEQGYLSTEDPIIRVRKVNDQYVLTYKSRANVPIVEGTCVNQEHELPLSMAAYEQLKQKISGILIQKTRYRMGYQGHVIELDIFHGAYEGMIVAEVEFSSLEEAETFHKPDWFGENVSGDCRYANVALATANKEE